MPDAPKHPVTVGDLYFMWHGPHRVDEPPNRQWRPATVADLVSALRAEGVLVRLEEQFAEMIFEYAHGSTLESPADLARVGVKSFFAALAEAQPFPPAGR